MSIWDNTFDATFGVEQALVINDVTHVQTVDNIQLVIELSVNNLTHVQSLTNVALTKQLTLDIQNITHVQEIENVQLALVPVANVVSVALSADTNYSITTTVTPKLTKNG